MAASPSRSTTTSPSTGPSADILVYIVDAEAPAVATIEVGNGSTFVSAGDFFDDAGDIEIDLGALGLDFATAVRVTHVSADVLPGFDLQAVEALNQIDLDDVVLDATPDVAENPGFTAHTVTATLIDVVAVEGVVVSFAVTDGPNVGTADAATTDALGVAEFTYSGEGGPGLDTVTAWLDVNGNGSPDAGGPSDDVTKEWHGVTGTIDLTDADGGGVVADDLLVVTVEERDLDTSDDKDTVEVMVFSESDLGFLLTLTETGSHTGVFQGFVQLGDELLAASSEMVTATYDDAFDGEGNDPAPVSATLEVGDTEEKGLKVTLCHIPSGNPENQHTITVGSSAASTHFEQHGDTFGECGVYDGPTKKEQQLEAFCEGDRGHRRCDELNGAEQSSQSGLQEGGDPDSTNSTAPALKKAESGSSNGELAAFCERKPDHRRCADYEGVDDSTDSGEEGDEAEE